MGVQVSGQGGYPIGYDIFEGNIYEGYTLIPMPHRFEKQFQIQEVTAY
ncbi:MAG: hypothetical protein LBF17_00780 [Mediterranea sp.]|nr:hypothetical protein [Mediterranea sp.]